MIKGIQRVRPALGRDDDHRLVLILGGAFLPSQLQIDKGNRSDVEEGRKRRSAGPCC